MTTDLAWSVLEAPQAATLAIRLMEPRDLPQLVVLSPRERKNPIDFSVYVTLVAEDVPLEDLGPETEDRRILGYCQFALEPLSKVLTSYAIRIAADAKGRGVGRALIQRQRQVAQEAGARLHIYHVDTDGEIALKKILVAEGLHLCQQYGPVCVYLGQL